MVTKKSVKVKIVFKKHMKSVERILGGMTKENAGILYSGRNTAIAQ